MTADRPTTPTAAPVSRRAVVRTGARLAYAAPLVAASLPLGARRAGAQGLSDPAACPAGADLCPPGDGLCCQPDTPVCCPTLFNPENPTVPGACCGEVFAGDTYSVCCEVTLGGACCPEAAPKCCPETCCEEGQTCGPDATCIPASGFARVAAAANAGGTAPRKPATAR